MGGGGEERDRQIDRLTQREGEGERQAERERQTDKHKERGRESDRQRENSELDTLLPKDRDFRQWPVLTICLAKLHRYIKMIITLSTLAR